jgi:hypothetical protein
MRTYKRDSSGRFAGGGGKARKAARPDSPVAPVPPTALRFQTGERLKAGLRKASASQLQAIDNSATSRQLRNAVFNEKARRASITKGSATGARLGGNKKVTKIDRTKKLNANIKAAERGIERAKDQERSPTTTALMEKGAQRMRQQAYKIENKQRGQRRIANALINGGKRKQNAILRDLKKPNGDQGMIQGRYYDQGAKNAAQKRRIRNRPGGRRRLK